MKTQIFTDDEMKLEEAYKVRFEVFVEEQKVPAGLEKDEFDALAVHVLVTDAEKPVATGRLFADRNDESVARLGRVAVLADYRNGGLGRKVCLDLLERAKIMGFKKVLIHAQIQVVNFYDRLGFKVCGSEFFEAGIKHVEMQLCF